jgi:putative transposase
LKRTWAPRGQTPELRTSLNHHQRINVIGALIMTAGERKLKLRARVHRRNVTGDEIIAFLGHLLRHIKGALLLVWDNAPIHQRQKVQQFISSQPRLHVENFPRYAPELNPVEFIWTQADEYIAGTAPANVGELKNNVQAALRRTRISQRKMKACLQASALRWP